eukprot:scaffold70714_cov65-Phaeocystis_antarctica.AAC.2
MVRKSRAAGGWPLDANNKCLRPGTRPKSYALPRCWVARPWSRGARPRHGAVALMWIAMSRRCRACCRRRSLLLQNTRQALGHKRPARRADATVAKKLQKGVERTTGQR